MAPTDGKSTIAYAAGASLAAVTLVYVFGPSWFIDEDSSGSASQRKKGVVGLSNPANDCFINSILQSLAGLEELRAYLIRRTHEAAPNAAGRRPLLTAALKDILDSLNERPLYRKTISNRPFLAVLERVFNSRISRTQQDAHEFLQVVAETLAEESRGMRQLRPAADEDSGVVITAASSDNGQDEDDDDDDENAMPLEGKLRSEIECQTCRFKPTPKISTFVVLTLPVPQKEKTTISECIDNALATEYIEDFQCASCKLKHAIKTFEARLATASADARPHIEHDLALLRVSSPEHPPPTVLFPPDAPKSRIARRHTFARFPRIIAFHLSRSIFDAYAAYNSRKNGARVAFQEHDLALGGILDRVHYRLLCVVTHKGGHESGHYECIRRQVVARSPRHSASAATSRRPSPAPTPRNSSSVDLFPAPNSPTTADAATPRVSESMPRVSESSSSITSASTRSASSSLGSPSSLTSPSATASSSRNPRGRAGSEASSSLSRAASAVRAGVSSERRHHHHHHKRRRAAEDRWWRISDDKIKEAKTRDVLDMQKEVYLLFYQRVDVAGEW